MTTAQSPGRRCRGVCTANGGYQRAGTAPPGPAPPAHRRTRPHRRSRSVPAPPPRHPPPVPPPPTVKATVADPDTVLTQLATDLRTQVDALTTELTATDRRMTFDKPPSANSPATAGGRNSGTTPEGSSSPSPTPAPPSARWPSTCAAKAGRCGPPRHRHRTAVHRPEGRHRHRHRRRQHRRRHDRPRLNRLRQLRRHRRPSPRRVTSHLSGAKQPAQ